jgi:hypothetical protein
MRSGSTARNPLRTCHVNGAKRNITALDPQRNRIDHRGCSANRCFNRIEIVDVSVEQLDPVGAKCKARPFGMPRSDTNPPPGRNKPFDDASPEKSGAAKDGNEISTHARRSVL